MKRLIILSIVILMGCQNDSIYEDNQLFGKWNLVEWTNKTNETKIDVKVDFEFDEDGRYIGRYGNAAEKGKYWISGNNLHTIEDEKAEKKVKITKLENDTLVFEMNRAGEIEEMILIKEK